MSPLLAHDVHGTRNGNEQRDSGDDVDVHNISLPFL